MSGTVHFLSSAEDSVSYPDPHFEILCEFLSQIAETNIIIAEDFDFKVRVSQGKDFRLMSLERCRVATLLEVLNELKRVSEPQDNFWSDITSRPRYQGAILHVQLGEDSDEDARIRLVQSLIETCVNFGERIALLIKESQAARSQFSPRQHLLILLQDRISWELRNRAAKENTTIQHVAKQIGCNSLIGEN